MSEQFENEVIGAIYKELYQEKQKTKALQERLKGAEELRKKARELEDIQQKIKEYESCVKAYKRIAVKAGGKIENEHLGMIVREIVKERREE